MPLQTLRGSSRPVAQPGPKKMAELQEMETTTRGGEGGGGGGGGGGRGGGGGGLFC